MLIAVASVSSPVYEYTFPMLLLFFNRVFDYFCPDFVCNTTARIVDAVCGDRNTAEPVRTTSQPQHSHMFLSCFINLAASKMLRPHSRLPCLYTNEEELGCGVGIPRPRDVRHYPRIVLVSGVSMYKEVLRTTFGRNDAGLRACLLCTNTRHRLSCHLYWR
jgi:hypothetical protein